MRALGFWPVAVVPVGRVAAATTLWRAKGRMHVTVVVKARFRFTLDQAMVPMLPEPVRPQEGELAPYLTQADVVLTAGHACACPPRPVEAVAVRLALYRNWAVLDKNLLVYGHNARADRTRTLFERVALVPGGDPMGLLVDPRDPRQGSSFARSGEDDPARQALAEGRGMPETVGAVTTIPPMFPWSYFQVSPSDQRSTYLTGDEWVVLDGMHPSYPRVQSQLPGARAEARVYPPGGTAGQGPCYDVAMEADRLNIDADQLTATVLWRGSFPVQSEATARALTIVGGVSMAGQAIAWPAVGDLVLPRESEASTEEAAGLPQEFDAMAQTLVRETRSGASERADVGAHAGGVGASAPLPDAGTPSGDDMMDVDGERVDFAGELGVTLEGVLRFSDDRGVGVGELGPDDIGTLELDPQQARKPLGNLDEFAPARPGTVLRPLIDGAAEPTQTAARTGASAPPALPAASVDRLELTLSDSLDDLGLTGETLAELSWRVPPKKT